MKKIKYLVLALAFFMFVPFIAFAEENVEETTTEEVETTEESEATEATNEVNVYLFRGQGCPHCEEAEEWFKSIEEEHGSKFKIVDYETWYNEDNKEIFRNVLKARNEYVSDEESLGVPYIVVGNKSWNGFSEDYSAEILDTINSEFAKEEKDRYDIMKYVDSTSNKKEESSSNDAVALLLILVVVLGIGYGISSARKKTN